MQEFAKLQISDLETLATDALKEITLEEADKIVGGKQLFCPEDTIEMPPLKPPKKKELGTSI
jgi:hypothetical protein